MPETTDQLRQRLAASIRPGVRDRLLDKGRARGMIWRDGLLPPDAPAFPSDLTEDLLDYAHTVIALALRLRTVEADATVLEPASLTAAEAIEAAVHRSEVTDDTAFHRVSSAVAFHLARYAARAYSVLPPVGEQANLAPTETVLVQLLRRQLDEMHELFASWLLDPQNQDAQIAERLASAGAFEAVDAGDAVMTTSYMKAIALFDYGLQSGEPDFVEQCRLQLTVTADAARDLNAVTHWWTASLTWHLVDDLWRLALHNTIPELTMEDDDSERWRTLRRGYIQRLRRDKKAAVELWPSQVEAARRAVDPSDNLVVALPTSAGKTRIAELCILRALASARRVVYVTPLRALSAQIERDLTSTFAPLGFEVSSLYGSAGIESGDATALREGAVVVSTPEKLDFALRNDPAIIKDVALIVLDEGHMLGRGEREVRYEALVQCLLRRDDAGERRLVCLSALFPRPDEMRDLVAWVRRDVPGEPVHSEWRPTRQHFGVLQWTGVGGRLQVSMGEESPFVPRFVEAASPPLKSPRRSMFPKSKNELTLAAAWRFVAQEKNVLVYCALRKSVEALGRLVIECVEQGVLEARPVSKARVHSVMAMGTEWLGETHPAVRCLEYGVALHHGGLPRPFLSEVERLMRAGECRVIIASPTLAQGVNLSASILLVPSIWRNRKVIPPVEFANVAGRAGRAFVDVEGLIVHVVWEETARKSARAIGVWNRLLGRASAPLVRSGILALVSEICRRIGLATGLRIEEVVEYVAGHPAAWKFEERAGEELQVGQGEWERDIASLDAAILVLLGAETEERELKEAVKRALEASLFARQVGLVAHLGMVEERARYIWEETSVAQRRGYHAAGVGLAAGRFLDAELRRLVGLLLEAEGAVVVGDVARAGNEIVGFAELVFKISPFRPPKELPERWPAALSGWVAGRPSAEVLGICGEEGADVLQEAVGYRLPWAMEAVRVHALAVGEVGAEALTGMAALVVEVGSADQSVIVLLRSGLSSREAARAAVRSTDAVFGDYDGMRDWLRSELVEMLSGEEWWPTEQSREAWVQFYERAARGGGRVWSREVRAVEVDWYGDPPVAGSHVVVRPRAGGQGGFVMSPACELLGEFGVALPRAYREVVAAKVDDRGVSVEVEFFG